MPVNITILAKGFQCKLAIKIFASGFYTINLTTVKTEMRNTTTINAPENANFMSEFMSVLPYGVLDKQITGCGGTTIALTNKENYILSVPNVEMITNKCYYINKDSELIFGVQSDTISKQNLEQYINNCKNAELPIKIMVTYDSTPKLIKMLIDLQLNPYQDFKLLVDEYQEFLTAYSYRSEAIDGLIVECKKFNYITYLSATPIPFEYEPEFLKILPRTDIIWANTECIKPIAIQSTKINTLLKNMITKYKMFNGLYLGEYKHNIMAKELYIFCNSVKTIKQICKDCSLSNAEVKIVCSDNAINKTTLGNLKISKAHDPNKGITFITSKAYKGTDFFSENGLIIVYSDASKENTLVSIEIDMYQIMGRLRNAENPFKNVVIHLYNNITLIDMDSKSFEKLQNIEEKESYNWIDWFNALDIDERQLYIEKKEPNIYSYFQDKQAHFNEMAKNHKQFEFDALKKTYNTGLTVKQAYEKSEKFKNSKTMIRSLDDTKIRGLFNSVELKDKYEYCYVGLDCTENIKEHIDVLGIDKIRALKYDGRNITKAYSLVINTENIKSELSKLNLSGFYSSDAIIDILKKIHDILDISLIPKAVDIMKYIQCRKTFNRINGMKLNGYTV
jgi:hypothetical protein